MPLIIHIQTLLKLILPYCDLLFDCNATSFSHAFSGKHRIFPLSSAWTKKGEACLFFGALLFYGVLKLRCLVFWLALCLASLSFSSTSELGSLSTLIPSLSAAFHSLPPSLKTQPSQLPQAKEGHSEAFKGTVTAAIILLSHWKAFFFPYRPSLGGSVFIQCAHPITTLYVRLTGWCSVYWMRADVTSPAFEPKYCCLLERKKSTLENHCHVKSGRRWWMFTLNLNLQGQVQSESFLVEYWWNNIICLQRNGLISLVWLQIM